jgi:acyl-CoA synthetase (NDP forming)
MFDIAKIASRQLLPAGPRVGLITNSAPLAHQMRDVVRAVGLPGDPGPVLLAPNASPADFADAVQSVLAGDTCDSIVCAAVRVFDHGADSVRPVLEQLARTAAKPLVAVLLDFDDAVAEAPASDDRGGLPVFDSSTDAIRALAAVIAYAHWRERDPGAVPMLDVTTDTAKRLVNRVLAKNPRGRELTDAEVHELLLSYGIDLVAKYPVHSLEEAVSVAERLGWNVVLKATADAVRGRPDLASVHRNIDHAEEMAEAWRDLTALVRELRLEVDEGLSVAVPVVQPMAPRGVALVITSREDAAFGPIVSLGLDGIPSELLGDTVYRVPPLTTVDAAAMVRDLRAAPTLFGRHGSPGVDIAAIENVLHRVAQLADDLPQLASLSLKPCVASIGGIAVLGAAAFIAPTGDIRDPRARTL